MNQPPSILVVDDEPDNFDVIEALLHQEGYQFHYCPNGPTALEQLNSFDPDVILLDVMMPQMDGIEVCRRIKTDSQWRSVPIIMVTALTDKEDLSRCLKAGADDFISKPVNVLELRARVHSMLRIKHQHDDLERLLHMRGEMVKLLESNLDEMRGSITHSLPHEFTTPINGILGSVDLLLNSANSLTPEDQGELLQLIRKGAKRMNRLIQNFLTYGRLELISSNPEATARIRNQLYITSSKIWILNFSEQLAKESNRMEDVKCCIEESILTISERDLRTIIEELLNNAFKFSPPGTPIQIVGMAKDSQYLLSISNQGRGMSLEQIARVGAFIQFERQHYEQQGSGLGLAIVKKMMELYGGIFSITSHPHEVTTIELGIPILKDT